MRALGPILLTVFLDLLGFGLVIPLLSFYAEDFQASELQVTLLMACYSLAQFLGAPLWGQVSDRYGRRPVLLISIGASVVFLSGFAAATTLWQLFVFRTLHGFAAANISTAQAAVADVTEGPDRARGMGLIGAAFGIGFSLGPFLGGQLSGYGLAAPIWLAAALSAINLIWVFFGFPETRPTGGAQTEGVRRRTINPRAMLDGLRHPIVGMTIGLLFVATFAFAMMEATFALVAEHSWSMTARDVGNLFGWIGMIGIVVQGGLIRHLVKRFGEPRLIVAGYLCNALGLLVLALASGTLGIWGGCALLALGAGMANPSLQALLSRSAPAEEQGTVLGVAQSFGSLARAVAPGVGGLLYAGVVPTAAFGAASVLMLVALVLAWPATRRAQQALLHATES
ncbi:MAG: MFS transporter [Myxococcota bacterium]